MSALRTKPVTVEIGGESFPWVFTLAVLADVEEEFGTITKMAKKMNEASAIIRVSAILCFHASPLRFKGLSDAVKFIGDKTLPADVPRIRNSIFESYLAAFKKDGEEDSDFEETTPNQ